MSGNAYKLKVEGLLEDVTEEELKAVFENKEKQGGGRIKDIELKKHGESCSAVITFQTKKAVELILKRGDRVVIDGVRAQVKSMPDTKEEKVKAKSKKACVAKVPKSPVTLGDVESAVASVSKSENKFKPSRTGVAKPKKDQVQSESAEPSSASDEDNDVSSTSGSKSQAPVMKKKVEASKIGGTRKTKSRVKNEADEKFEDVAASVKKSETSKTKQKVSKPQKPSASDTLHRSQTREPSSSPAHLEESSSSDFSDEDFTPVSKSESSKTRKRAESGSTEATRKAKSRVEKELVHRGLEDDAASVKKSEVPKTKQKVSKHQKPSVSHSPGKSQTCESSSSPVDSEESDEEETLWERTVKAKIDDVTKNKEFYCLYLDSFEVCAEKYDEDSIMLDGLRSYVYITFDSRDVALEVCEMEHDEDSNIITAEMATEEDFDTYQNLMSVHGHRFDSDELRKDLIEFVELQTDEEVVEVIVEDEINSAVVVFDPESCHDVTDAIWKCTDEKFKNKVRLRAAPVFRTHSVKVTGINPDTNDKTLARYLSNKRLGGGDLKSVFRRTPTEAVVTFEKEESYNRILKKNDYSLERSPLTITPVYSCLSKEIYKECIQNNDPPDSGTDMQDSDSQHSGDEWEDASQEIDKDEVIYAKEHEEELTKPEVILLQKSNFGKTVKNKNKGVELEFGDSSVIIKANEKSTISQVQVEVLQITKDIKSTEIQQSLEDRDQIEQLHNADVQKKINYLLGEQDFTAHLECSQNKVTLFYMKGERVSQLEDIVKSQVVVKERQVSKDMIPVYESQKGQEYLDELRENSDGSGVRLFIKLMSQEEKLKIIAPSSEHDDISDRLNDFEKNNRLHTNEIPFPEGKLQFIQRFNKGKMEEIEDMLAQLGTKVMKAPDQLILQGLEEGITEGDETLSRLREEIKCQEVTLKGYGVEEYLQDTEGMDLRNRVEEKNSCIIMTKSDLRQVQGAQGKAVHGIMPPVLKARAQVGGTTIQFMRGDITEQKVDVIVNPLDMSLMCSSQLGKKIISKGGMTIQDELDRAHITKSAGAVAETHPGLLSNCKAILHVVVCPQETRGDSVSKLGKAAALCLEYVENKGYKSVAMPILGIEEMFGFSEIAACNQLMKSVLSCLKNNSSLNEVFLCDAQTSNVKLLIDRCSGVKVEEIGKLAEASGIAKASKTSGKRKLCRKAAGGLNVEVTYGEITKQRTNVIVTTVDKSLDLTKGYISKKVLENAGNSVQQELNQNYADGIKTGRFAETGGGNLESDYIFHVCLGRWGDESESFMKRLITKLLKRADVLNAESLSIPALGAGALKYPQDAVARAFRDGIDDFVKGSPGSSLNSIKVVLSRGSKDTQVYESTLLSKRRDDSDEDEEDNDGNESNDDDDDDNAISTGPRNEFSFGRVKLRVKTGDITQETCGAIVVGVKDSMDLSKSGAISKAVLKKCGQELQQECDDKKDEMAQNGFVMTSALSLKCEAIIFVSIDRGTHSWEKCLAQVLEYAEKQNITSLALPALGSGARDVNYQRIKEKIFTGVKKFGSKGRRSLRDVRLVLYSQRVMDEILGPAVSGGGTSAQKVTISEDVRVQIYSDSPDRIEDAAKELKLKLERAFKEEKDGNKDIKKLSDGQVKKLQSKGQELGVKVSVDRRRGQMLMESFKPQKFAGVLRALTTLIVESVKQESKSIPPSIQWQYQRDGKWTDFDQAMNLEIERKHQKGSDRHKIQNSKGYEFLIDFKNNKEYPVGASGNPRKEGFTIRRIDLTKGQEPLPDNWDPMADSETLKLVTLQPGTPEYNSVLQNFQKTASAHQVRQIDRIQNKALYQQYAVKKREIDQRNPKNHQNEHKLFHGTNAQTVTLINENGFNRSHNGVNVISTPQQFPYSKKGRQSYLNQLFHGQKSTATVHGDGTYFAVNASYSVNYAQPDNTGIRRMYQASVLVGETTQSQHGMKNLPLKPGTHYPYDSSTDNLNNVAARQMYIIFHDSQAYPEYLITFT